MYIGNYIALLLSTSVVPSPPPLCSSPLHLLVYEQSSEGSLKIPSEREATGAYAIRLLHVCGDVAFGKKKKKQSGDKSTPAYCAPAKCLAPACCLVWGGRSDLSESEGAG